MIIDFQVLIIATNILNSGYMYTFDKCATEAEWVAIPRQSVIDPSIESITPASSVSPAFLARIGISCSTVRTTSNQWTILLEIFGPWRFEPSALTFPAFDSGWRFSRASSLDLVRRLTWSVYRGSRLGA
nr:hypothetical protein CFP56_09615 [Quercus suber]